MVDIDIPQKYAVAPTGEGTPHLTIHPEATIDLDSTNAFEGPEKLLEVWFTPSPNDLPASALPGGLKNVSAETWKEMLDLVNCKVLSVVSSDHLDAYLLSESSMFVFPHKLILKTCGTTTLLSGLPKMLEIAAHCAGFPYIGWARVNGLLAAATPYRVFYSRKNFLYPDKQRGPHRSWRDEVRFLDGMFIGGSAYMVGKMNGEHWYLYITGPDTRLTPPSSPEWGSHVKVRDDVRLSESPVDAISSHMDSMQMQTVEDETLEVLMTDLDPENAKQFYLDHASAVAADKLSQLRSPAHQVANMDETEVDVFGNVSAEGDDFTPSSDASLSVDEYTTEGHALGTIVSESCGLSEVYPTSRYPDARIDAYLFTPCGFSANGVIPAPEQDGRFNSTHYFTVHVTPESQCSYASFETNVPCRQTGRETAEIVEQVVNIFRPGRFSVTLFEAKSSSIGDVGIATDGGYIAAKRTGRMDCIKGYRRIERIVHDLNGYDLVFRYYHREDWKGGAAPRLGELSM
ncbi:MAG: spermidine resistance protein [Peltula sp. TS41687]|nr:MAG: spermidine resistance protein [Peltula sp. TS41687]